MRSSPANSYIHTLSFSIPCRRTQPSTHEQQSKDLKDLSVSTNVAYGQVKYAPNTYEELDRLAAAASGGGAPVYATADETTATPTGK